MEKHRLNTYPEITGEEFEDLKASIAKAYNPLYPIVAYEGAVLDGWNRYRACLAVNVEPIIVEFEGTPEEALIAVIESNKRRNMTASQAAMMAVRNRALWDMLATEAKERQVANLKQGDKAPVVEQIPQRGKTDLSPPQPSTSQRAAIACNETVVAIIEAEGQCLKPTPPPDLPPMPPPVKATMAPTKTREKIAEMHGVNDRYIQDAKRILTTRPDLAEKIDSGAMSIPEAKKVERDAQRAERNAAQAAQVRDRPDAPRVTLAHYRDWLPAQPEADLLLTDPPYSTDVPDVEAFAADWLPMALAKVKPTGRAYIFIGAYPHELAAYCNVAIPTQILVWTYRNTLGPTPKYDYIRNLQFLLYYRQPDAPPLDCPNLVDQISVWDFNHPARSADRLHAWQKLTEAVNRIILHATEPGQTILDPFCCTGTFPCAAAQLGRIGLGCDIDQDNLNIAIERGCVYDSTKRD
jgi:hypothetical protein